MATNVGAIEYDARIDTKNLRGDAARAEGIAKSTGDNLGTSMEKGTGRASAALAKMARFAKVAAVLTAAALAAAIGKFVIGGGISRALNIEDAQAKLRGLGHDAKSVGQIMDSALKSVKGTAFGLDAAATAAASAVAAGVKPGKELTRVLALTGDTATIMGRDFNEAGAIINKVLAGNRLSMEEVNQLQDAGLPILSMLGKEYGKTALQMREMVSNGEIDSKRFLVALQTNIGGAALASGNTTRGAWLNMQAAMARVGAAIVEDIIPRVRDAFGAMTVWFDANSAKIVSAIGRTIEFIKSFGNSAVNVASQVITFLGPSLTALWNTLNTQVIPVLQKLWKEVIAPLAPVIGKVLVAALWLLINVFNVQVKIATFVYNGFLKLVAVIKAFAGAIRNAIEWVVGIYRKLKDNGAWQAFLGAADRALGPIDEMVGGLISLVSELIGLISQAGNDASFNASKVTGALGSAANAALESGAKGKRALGGPVSGGSSYLVGEQGPEIFTPKTSGNIIPNNELSKAGSSVSITINMAGIMARSRADLRDIGKDIIRAVNEELTSKQLEPIGGADL